MSFSPATGQENYQPVGNQFGFRVSTAPEAVRDMVGTKAQIIASMQGLIVLAAGLSNVNGDSGQGGDISTDMCLYSCHLYDFNQIINLCLCCSGPYGQAHLNKPSKSAAQSYFFDQYVIDCSFL
jgi:hypothetical protein